ncbi:MAG: hypothetical protein SFY32_07025 [Bacteroidota bacterium]|nr:hypothetical protein [Bacteroidota bacterium]
MNFNYLKTNIIASLILMFAAFYNGYPILFVGDSFGYYHYGLKLDHDTGAHSFLYGLFVAGSSLHYSFWFVAFIQCLLVSLIINQALKIFSNYKCTDVHFFLIVVFLTFFTSFSKYTAKVMPDVYIGLIALLIFIILYGEFTKAKKFILLILTSVLVCFHNSFYFISCLSTLMFIIYLFVDKRKDAINENKWFFLGLIVLPMLITLSFHLVFFKKAYFNKSAHVYLMAKLSDSGILKKYLDNNCNDSTSILCKYKEYRITLHDFLHNREISPTHKEFGSGTQGIEGSKKEYKELIYNILSNPKYLFLFVEDGIINMFHNLADFNHYEQSGDIMSWHFSNYFPNQISQYYHSKQLRGSFEIYEKVNNLIEFIIVVLSILYIIYSFNSLNVNQKKLIVLSVIFIFANSYVTGQLAEVVPRFSQRIIWMVPMLAAMTLISKSIKGFSFIGSPSDC